MPKMYFVVLCFLVLTNCEHEKPIVISEKVAIEKTSAEKDYFDSSFSWLDTDQENDFGFPQEICFEETFNEKTKKQKAEFTPTEIKEIGRAVVPQLIEYSFPNTAELKLIGRIAEGLAKWKVKAGGWQECGKIVMEKEAIQSKAIFYAHLIVEQARNFNLNPWGLLGIFANESRFDSCALGLYPRKKAYQLGLIKKRKRGISHSKEEILVAINDQRLKKSFGRTGVDIGLGQLLSRFYRDPSDYERMLDARGSVSESARWAHNIIKGRGTQRFWLFWRGTAVAWYDRKIVKWARMLGAYKNEI